MTTDEIKDAARFKAIHLGGNGNTDTLTPFAIHEMMAAYAKHRNRVTLQSLMAILDTHLPHDSDGTERDAIRKNIIGEFEKLINEVRNKELQR